MIINFLSGEVVASYEYDETGLRTKKTVGTKSYEYYYEGGNLSIQVEKENGTVKGYTQFVYDNVGQPLAMVTTDKATGTSKVYYYITNKRGDVLKILDANSQTVAEYSYDAYGKILSETGTLAASNPIRYAGYYYDTETKFYYLNARYYDPANGNFLSLDPHPGDEDDPISQNGYTYAQNNPVLYVDPDGHHAKEMYPTMKRNARKMRYASFLPHVAKLGIFYKLVRNSGPWDYKQKYNHVLLKGKKMTGEAFGNLHYGYVGTALGLYKHELLVAAGIAQKRAGTSKGFSFSGSYWDDPRDQKMIKKGIKMYYEDR